MQTITNLEQYLALALIANELTDQEPLLMEVRRLQGQPNGFETWQKNWLELKVEPYIYHANSAKYGLDIGHPVTWPKSECPYLIKVGPKPNDPVYYITGVVAVIKTASKLGFFLKTFSPYFLVWHFPWDSLNAKPEQTITSSVPTKTEWAATFKVLEHLSDKEGLVQMQIEPKKVEAISRHANGLRREIRTWQLRKKK